MGLLAAFAVLALAPQDPTPSPAPRPTAVLAAQEERGEAAEPGVLAQLAQGDDAAIAARAAWGAPRARTRSRRCTPWPRTVATPKPACRRCTRSPAARSPILR
jgi:hypothetical protein